MKRPRRNARIDATSLAALARANPDTPAFRRWFGDSVVVDDNGEPLAVYHGGADVLSLPSGAFRRGKALSKWGRGIYFTPYKWRAEDYARDNDGVVGAYYLRLENPLVLNEAQAYFPHTEALIEEAPLKHDGLVIVQSERPHARPRFERNVTEIVVFDPKQIKSAYHNVGTFDPEHEDVRANPRGRRAIRITLERAATAPEGTLLVALDGGAAFRKTGLGKTDWTPQMPSASSPDGWKDRPSSQGRPPRYGEVWQTVMRELKIMGLAEIVEEDA